jgi:DNA-binding transcriptional regulator YdaS (Cro superfamily)
MDDHPVERAIGAAGGLSELAARMKVSPQVISNWRRRGVPAGRVLELERATANAEGVPVVTRHDLRPDLYPVEHAA